jgi:ketosteroid isomerase-like protein
MNKIITLLFAGLLIAGAQSVSAQSGNKDAEAIKKELTATAEGWNNGDLKKYLAAYVPGAQEMTSEGPKGGVEHIEQTMKNGFWKTGRPLQVLRYENIAVTMLGKKNALVTGQYVLSGGGRPDRKGWFTTVWVKTKDGWRMMHDHS